MASILPISGVLGKDRAAHLLRRTTFGITIQQVNAYANKTASQAMSSLLVATSYTDKPLNVDGTGTSFLDSDFDSVNDGIYNNYGQIFWLNKFLKDETAFSKIALFWNNHFAISSATGNRYIHAFRYYTTLNQHALGNFKDFIIAMTKDPLMLLWLNGHENQKGANNIPSNENYARELQELFTIGATAPDGTANYTETDVREAARVLTGWRTQNSSGNINTLSSQFFLNRHDIDDKQFSAKYQNTIIQGKNTATAGDEELVTLIDMILAQPECAKFICRKLYKWFVAAEISTEIETDIITPLANTFRSNNYQILPVIAQLLSSEHFYSEAIKGSIIKHPLDFILNIFRFGNLPTPDPATQTAQFYPVFEKGIRSVAQTLRMNILKHDTVFGWEAFYQTEMYKIWINSTSLRTRMAHSDLLVSGYSAKSFKVTFDVIPLTEAILQDVGYTFANKTSPTATDILLADKIIEGFCYYLYPKSCTSTQIQSLKDTLLLQGELNETGFWFEWKYYADGDTAAQNGLKVKLNNMLKFMLKSPEFHLI